MYLYISVCIYKHDIHTNICVPVYKSELHRDTWAGERHQVGWVLQSSQKPAAQASR